MITSNASEGLWSGAAAAGRESGIGVEVKSAVSLLLVALLFPLVILLIGAPIALCVRLLLEIAQRWSGHL